MGVEAIIVAGGKGERLGFAYNKLLHEVNGKPIILYTLETFEKISQIDQITLVSASDDIGQFLDIVMKNGLTKVKKLKGGGFTRLESVFEAIRYLDDETVNNGYVLIHDGARPFVSQGLIERCLEDCRMHGASCAAVPAINTIKQGKEYFTATIPREDLWEVQTPQCYKAKEAMVAYSNAIQKNCKATDDSTLLELIGIPVKITMGEYSNIKITNQTDLKLMEMIIGK